MFHPINLKDYPMYLEDLMYLEVRNLSDVPRRFVNLYIMVIMKDFLAFLDNGYYNCFMITSIKDLSIFLDTCIRSL